MISVKRAYEKPEAGDGPRFLVDRLWPRGISKQNLRLTEWLKDIAPSPSLRKWFGHDADKWNEFQRRYFAELRRNPESLVPLLRAARAGDMTLVYGARDAFHNNAVALRSYLDRKARGKKQSRRFAQGPRRTR